MPGWPRTVLRRSDFARRMQACATAQEMMEALAGPRQRGSGYECFRMTDGSRLFAREYRMF